MRHQFAPFAATILAVAGLVTAGTEPINTTLVGTWDEHDGGIADVWGDGDYAYLGHFGDGAVHIVDISDPTSPTTVTEYFLPPPGSFGSAQDVKVAEGLLFIAPESVNEITTHIVDVRDPQNPVAVVDVAIPGFGNIHNVFYDQGYLYVADSNTPRVGIIDLNGLDPDFPPVADITMATWILEGVGSSIVHDITVTGGRLYASAWDSGVWIYDVTNVANEAPPFLGSAPGDNTHSCWPTDDGHFVITGEERPGGGIIVHQIVTEPGGSLTLNVTDAFAMPIEIASSVHNQVAVGNRIYNSWYGAGLRVYDIDPDGKLQFVAAYDTPELGATWGVYPFLGADRVLLSDISDGLVVVSLDEPVFGDLDGDGTVDGADLGIVLGAWGPCPDCPADLDGDGDVNGADLGLLLGAWG